MTRIDTSRWRFQRLSAALAFCAIAAIFGASGLAQGTVAEHGEQSALGELRGRIVVTGNRPSIVLENIPPELAVCAEGALGLWDDHVIVGNNGGLADVFVILTPLHGDAMNSAPPAHDENIDAPQLTFANCRIMPHASIVRAGQELVLINADPVGHQVQIQTWNNECNIQLPSSSQTRIRLENPDPSPGQVRCGIHRWMDGVILVADHPWATLTDSKGEFRLANLPAGRWRAQFWHSRLGYLFHVSNRNRSIVTDEKGQIEVTVEGNSVCVLDTFQVDGDRLAPSQGPSP